MWGLAMWLALASGMFVDRTHSGLKLIKCPRLVRLSSCTLGVSLEKRLGVGGFWLFILGPRMNMCERSLSLICSLQPLQPITNPEVRGKDAAVCLRFLLTALHCLSAISHVPDPTLPRQLPLLFPDSGSSCLSPSCTASTSLPTNPNGLLLHSFQVSIQHPLHKRISRASHLNFSHLLVYFSPWYSIIQRTC